MDQQIFLLINSLSRKSQLLDFFGIFFADYLGYFLIGAVLVYLFSLKNLQQRFHQFSFLILNALLARGIITEIIRFFYHRPRPFLVLGLEPLVEEINKGAFPSGHAAFYFALALSVFLFNKKMGKYLLVGAVLVGLGRVFVAVHWPLDILGGFLAALLSTWSLNKIKKWNTQPMHDRALVE